MRGIKKSVHLTKEMSARENRPLATIVQDESFNTTYKNEATANDIVTDATDHITKQLTQAAKTIAELWKQLEKIKRCRQDKTAQRAI